MRFFKGVLLSVLLSSGVASASVEVSWDRVDDMSKVRTLVQQQLGEKMAEACPMLEGTKLDVTSVKEYTSGPLLSEWERVMFIQLDVSAEEEDPVWGIEFVNTRVKYTVDPYDDADNGVIINDEFKITAIVTDSANVCQ
ncbi:MAG: hypothetical protein AB8E15_08415 [Bdellovibrionales bacterium]